MIALGLDARLAAVYGMVTNLDRNVGRLLARLDRLGRREDTIAVFVGDNGPNDERWNGGLRDREGSSSRRRRSRWATLRAGTLDLPAGRARITLEAVHRTRAEVMELKHVALGRVAGAR